MGYAATLWLPLGISLRVIYHTEMPSKKSVKPLILDANSTGLASLIASISVLLLLIYSSYMDNFMFYAVEQYHVDFSPPNGFAEGVGQGLKEAMSGIFLGFAFWMAFLFIVIIGGYLSPLLLLIAILVITGTALLVRIFRWPLEFVLAKIFESEKGVLTQIGVGIAAFGKTIQFILNSV